MQRKLVRIANAVLDLEPYVTERAQRQTREINSGVLKLDSNEAAKNASPRVIDSIREFLNSKPLNWYPESEALDLRMKIAEYVSLPSDFIGCYAGAGLALEHVFKTYLELGTELVVAGPCSSNVMTAALSTGARVIDPEPKDIFNPTIEEVVNKITSRTRAVYLKTPNEFTGAVFSEAELVFLLAYAERTMIIIDEEFFEFSGSSMADLTARFPNLTVVRSFANAFGLAGIKAAYIVTDPENLEFINRVKGDAGPDSIAQIAALSALEDIDYTREYTVEVNQSKKAIAVYLPETGYEFHMTGANYFLLRVSDIRGAINSLRSDSIEVMDLSGVVGLEGYLRITIGSPEQTDKLLLALSKMAGQYATGYNRNRMTKTESRIKNEIKKPVFVK